MDKYFEIFLKSIVTASGIVLISGVCFTLKVLITYSDTLNSIERRITGIENTQNITDQKTNMIYNYFIQGKK